MLMETKEKQMKIKILPLLMVLVICLLPLHVFAECTEGNCTDGKGTRIYPPKGLKYVGEFKNGKRDGTGVLVFPDETKSGGQKQYEGEWKEDKPSGQGTLTFTDGHKFVGTWKYETTDLPADGPITYTSNVLSAEGTMFYPDGRKEAGEFKNDKFQKK
jgi:hypothetical protein